MEARIFTIVDTDSQTTKEINSTATTIGELKRELTANGFNVEDKTIQEAITRIEFKDDNSVIPHDVPYRNTTTNNLVFRLTKSNKHVKSGSSRQDLYVKIKSMNLAAEVQKRFNKNFTQVSTEALETFVAQYEHMAKTPEQLTDTKPAEDCSCEQKLRKLCDILYNNDYIDGDDINDIFYSNDQREFKSSVFSKQELDELINNL